MAPLASKRIELIDTPSTEVGQTHSKDTMQNSSTDDRIQRKFMKRRRDKHV